MMVGAQFLLTIQLSNIKIRSHFVLAFNFLLCEEPTLVFLYASLC